jgi:uncharacterized protein YdhG (YjbR/CyaY superfamily)
MASRFRKIDDYIKTFSPEVQLILEKIRKTIQKEAPEAVESIGYQMPAFKFNGKYIIYFAAYKNHIGFYPIPRGDAAFENKLAPYIKGKGTVQFPLTKPIPYGLVKNMVKFRMKENITKEE